MGRKIAALGLILVLTGCRKEVKAYVECLATPQGATCTVTHKQGKEAAGVCWDVKVACANGSTVVGSGCQNVQPEAKTSLIIPGSQFKGGTCDRMTGVAVENLKVGPVLSALPTQQQGATPAAEEYVVIPQSSVELKAPPGWTREKSGEWGLLGAPDKHALLAFVVFSNAGESTAKLVEVARVLGASNIKWGSPKSINIGPDNLPSRVADGTCTFAGGDGDISYATVNPGGVQQILVVYAVKKGASKEVQDQAAAVVRSMRKKR